MGNPAVGKLKPKAPAQRKGTVRVFARMAEA